VSPFSVKRTGSVVGGRGGLTASLATRLVLRGCVEGIGALYTESENILADSCVIVHVGARSETVLGRKIINYTIYSTGAHVPVVRSLRAVVAVFCIGATAEMSSAQIPPPPVTPGAYYSVSYSGGAITVTPTGGFPTVSPYRPINDSWGYGAGCRYGTSHAEGTITATFTWHGDTNNDGVVDVPPPAVLFIKEESSASITFGSTGTTDNGLPNQVSPRYWVKTDPGDSFVVECSRSASHPLRHLGDVRCQLSGHTDHDRRPEDRLLKQPRLLDELGHGLRHRWRLDLLIQRLAGWRRQQPCAAKLIRFCRFHWGSTGNRHLASGHNNLRYGFVGTAVLPRL
jgi:hypothetical protein